MYWTLRGHTPVPTDDVLIWARCFENIKIRRVAETTIEHELHDAVRVSTVFLGIDHNWCDVGPPLLFESMVFGGPLDEHQFRYATWDEAAAGHAMLVDEAVLEGKVSVWELGEQLKALAAKSRVVEQVVAKARAPRKTTRKVRGNKESQ